MSKCVPLPLHAIHPSTHPPNPSSCQNPESLKNMAPVRKCMLEIRNQNVKGRVINIRQWSKDHQPNPDRCREEGKKEKVFSSINQSSLGSPHRLTHTNLLCINACGNLHVAQSWDEVGRVRLKVRVGLISGICPGPSSQYAYYFSILLRMHAGPGLNANMAELNTMDHPLPCPCRYRFILAPMKINPKVPSFSLSVWTCEL